MNTQLPSPVNVAFAARITYATMSRTRLPKQMMTHLPRFAQRRWIWLLLVPSVVSFTQAYPGRSTATSIDQTPDSLPTLLQDHGYMAVPLEHVMNGLYTVPTTVNSTPIALVLDCGFSGGISILRSIADSLGIHGSPDRPAIGLSGTTITDTTHLPHFALGTMRLDSQFLQISRALPVPNGLLGAYILTVLNTVMDYTSNTLYIDSTSAHSFTGLQSFATSHGAVAIPLTRLTEPNLLKGRYTLQAVVGSTPVTLLIDTGAEQDIILDQQRADALGIQATEESAVNVVGGSAEVHMGSLERLTLGSMHLDSLSLMVLDLSSVNNRYAIYGFSKIDGILGAGVFNAHRTIIDFGHDMLYFWP